MLLIGEAGTGKTHLATGLCAAACRQRRRVRFTTATGLNNELAKAASTNQLSRALGRWARLDLIASTSRLHAARRNRLRADVPGDRQPGGESGGDRDDQPAVLRMAAGHPEPTAVKALIDRLTDQAHIITTGTDSYRFRRTTAQRKAAKE